MKRLKDFLHSEPIQEDSPDTNGDGYLSPEELHRHLDIQKRGVVDICDYAAHVLFHSKHPEYLAPYEKDFNDIQRRHASGEEVNPHDDVLHKLKSSKALTTTDYPVMEGRSGRSTEMDPPAVLIMRRKYVRQFPNGQRVALYYVDKINKYVTVPYEDLQWGGSFAKEETVFDKLSHIIEQNESVDVEHLDGSTSEITPSVAQNIMNLYNKINENNKAKMKDMMESSSKHFQAIARFSKE